MDPKSAEELVGWVHGTHYQLYNMVEFGPRSWGTDHDFAPPKEITRMQTFDPEAMNTSPSTKLPPEVQARALYTSTGTYPMILVMYLPDTGTFLAHRRFGYNKNAMMIHGEFGSKEPRTVTYDRNDDILITLMRAAVKAANLSKSDSWWDDYPPAPPLSDARRLELELGAKRRAEIYKDYGY